MTCATPELTAIAERVSTLERQNRVLRQGMIANIVVFLSIILMGQAKPSPRIVEAQQFVLKDANGAVHGRLGVLPKGSEMILGNDTAQPIMSMRVGTDSGDLHFYGTRRSGMNLGINSGSPSISIQDVDGHGSAGLTFGENGPSLKLEDGDGFSTLIGTTPIEKLGEGQAQHTTAASVVLYDKRKKVLWRAP